VGGTGQDDRALEKLDEGERGFAIAVSWLRSKLDRPIRIENA
jgi:hypothetical protein